MFPADKKVRSETAKVNGETEVQTRAVLRPGGRTANRQTLLRRSRSRPLVRDERNCGKGARYNLNGPIRVKELAAHKPKRVMVISMDDY